MLDDREYMRPINTKSSKPWTRSMAINLIAVTVAMFFAGLLTHSFNQTRFLAAQIPRDPTEVPMAIVGLLTYMFRHDDFSHLFWNMFGVWIFGRHIERQLGQWSFLRLYVGSGLIASVVWAAVTATSGDGGWMYGASGALFAILITTALLEPNLQVLLFFVVPVKMKWMVLGYMVITVMSLGDASRISHLTHLGGAIGGFLMMFLFHRASIRMTFDDLVPGFIGKAMPKNTRRRSPDPIPFKKPGASRARKEDDSDPFTKIDPILDKIGKHGMKSLTEDEKRLLERARKKLK